MTTVAPPPPRFVIKGWHVLIMFLLFFGADIAVNTVFMIKAYSTFPGETSMTPYEDGLAYNAALKQRRQQALLGWKLAAGAEAPDTLRVEVSDRTGAPLRGLRVSADLQRPATETGRHSVSFQETAPGVYTALHQHLDGAWDMEVSAQDSQGRLAKADRRLIQP
jgi:nitrogen fixation protein FixH